MSETAQAKATHSPPQLRELPSGWRWVRLEEVTSIVNGTTPDSENPCFWNGDIVWITPTDLGKLAEPYIRNSDRKITKVGFDSRNLTQVPPRSVVLSSRAPIGHLGIAAVGLCTNQGCKSFIPNEEIHEWFLYFALKRSVWKLQQIGSGATFAEISKTQLENFIIPLPPIEEQRRIAGMLREQMAAVEKARAASQSRLEAVKALPAAFLRQVFPQPGQPLPDGWRWVRLEKVIGEAQAGFACGLRDTQGIAQLRMNNLDTHGNFVWDEVLRVPHDSSNIEKFKIVPGDVLFNNTNSTELVGKSALFEGYCEPLVYSNHFTRLRTITEALFPDFLASWLNYQWQQGVFAAICNRWIGQSAVKADKLLNLDFPLPPLDEQQRIAAMLREQMAAADKARVAAEEELNTINALPAALLCRAFNGEL